MLGKHWSSLRSSLGVARLSASAKNSGQENQANRCGCRGLEGLRGSSRTAPDLPRRLEWRGCGNRARLPANPISAASRGQRAAPSWRRHGSTATRGCSRTRAAASRGERSRLIRAEMVLLFALEASTGRTGTQPLSQESLGGRGSRERRCELPRPPWRPGKSLRVCSSKISSGISSR